MDFLAFLNAWITMREADGWLAERHHFWFGTDQWYEMLEAPPVR